LDIVPNILYNNLFNNW